MLKIDPTEQRQDLWLAANDWKSYEAYVTGTLERRFPGLAVKSDVKLIGQKSGAHRQVDVLVDGDERIAFDCKCYKRKVDIKQVEEFLGMLDDLGIRHGVLVTKRGYSKAALRRAQNDDREIELQILSPSRLSQYQHIGDPLIWRNGLGVFLTRPEGWVADNQHSKVKGAFQVAMYPLGHTLESAARSAPFMYANILSKNPAQKNMAEFADWHEACILSTDPEAKFERSVEHITDEKDETRDAVFRSAKIPTMRFGLELSLYVDYGNSILLLVMLSPPDKLDVLKQVLFRSAERTFSLAVLDK